MPKPRSDSRQRILASARALLRRQGYHGTGLAQIIEHSGAPRGSVYFLFPGGKEQVAVEAITAWTIQMSAWIHEMRAESHSAADWVERMTRFFAAELNDSDFAEGFPLTTVTLDSVPASAALTEVCRQAYGRFLADLVDGLIAFGTARPRAQGLATLMLASLEGAAVLCRAFQSTAPLEQILPHVTAAVTEPGKGGGTGSAARPRK